MHCPSASASTTPDEATHDAQRGLKNFRKALEGLQLLHAAGFEVGITRQVQSGEDRGARSTSDSGNCCASNGLPEDLSIVALPQLGALDSTAEFHAAGRCDAEGSAAHVPAPVLARPDADPARRPAQAHAPARWSTMSPLSTRPPDLAAALAAPIVPAHRRCSLCLGGGVNYVGADPPAGV